MQGKKKPLFLSCYITIMQFCLVHLKQFLTQHLTQGSAEISLRYLDTGGVLQKVIQESQTDR